MPYFGGKSQSGVWQRIVNLIPPHDVYIEPFLGSGAIFRLKKPAAKNIGLDLAAPDVALLQGLDFRRACGIRFLEAYRFKGREFVYADPPYLLETRKTGARYEFEMTRPTPFPALVDVSPSTASDRPRPRATIRDHWRNSHATRAALTVESQ